MQGLRSPWGLASPPARRCAAPVRELAPRGCVAETGVSLRPRASLHRLPTLCRPFHGLIPQVMLGCRGCARPLGLLHRLPTLCRPFHGLIPWVMLGCRGFARPLGSLHRLPTLCRPFHGLPPRPPPGDGVKSTINHMKKKFNVSSPPRHHGHKHNFSP